MAERVDDDLAAQILASIRRPDPARIVCVETGYGSGIECYVVFAGHRFAVTEITSRWHPVRRQSDRELLQQETWRRFWRYLGAA